MIHWLAVGRMASLAMTQSNRLAWYRTFWLGLPSWKLENLTMISLSYFRQIFFFLMCCVVLYEAFPQGGKTKAIPVHARETSKL